ncbi:DnaA ATPase domain-containing protein [Geobacter sp. SVR]|uniref:DnaA/Hda family protein n=1 Tax=Geobacter sp. SVR TaxID=2495594 RepID=UPI00143EF9C6|nr:DnaA/Hda family protein [Geobacter sp. SVR]BCS53708.1 DnaA regulatory inactivator Hda [Geobacter sp. SVR]GCF85784.1 DnaA regulatory inactivator Hda [Geobacter sp. SVR]
MQQIFEFPVASLLTFDSFIGCDGNSAAVQFARRIADPADAENLLYLYGPSGSGKTHLLKAIAHALGSACHCAIPCLSCRDILSADQLFEVLNDAPALLVDDLHLLRDDPSLRGGLWQVFNDHYTAGRKIALAGLHSPRELPHLDDHLISRLLWGLVSRLDTSDDDSRRMILKKIADDRQVRVPDDVVDYILITTSREVGDLITTFETLYRLSMAQKRKISLSLARESREYLTAGGRPL